MSILVFLMLKLVFSNPISKNTNTIYLKAFFSGLFSWQLEFCLRIQIFGLSIKSQRFEYEFHEESFSSKLVLFLEW